MPNSIVCSGRIFRTSMRRGRIRGGKRFWSMREKEEGGVGSLMREMRRIKLDERISADLHQLN